MKSYASKPANVITVIFFIILYFSITYIDHAIQKMFIPNIVKIF